MVKAKQKPLEEIFALIRGYKEKRRPRDVLQVLTVGCGGCTSVCMAGGQREVLVLNEELTRAGANGPGFSVHNDINGQYFKRLVTPEQADRWLPGYCSGELITAIAMSEPGAGSDLQGIRTSAVKDGNSFILNGQKTFISNGQLADLVIVVARTDPDAGHRGISLLVVERGMPGFERGRNLDKVGMHAQDTSELFFSDVRVPAGNLLG